MRILTFFFLTLFLLLPVGSGAQSTSSAAEDVLRSGFQYRNLGPFRVGGWVSEIAVDRKSVV